MQLDPLNRCSFSVSDLIIYGECPAKLLYTREPDLSCPEGVWTAIVVKSFDWLCTKILSGKFPSQKSFNECIGQSWKDLKSSIATSISTDLLLSIRSKCDKLYRFLSKMDGLEIIAHQQEFKYTTKKFSIDISATVLRHESSIYTFYLDPLVSYTRINRLYVVAHNILRKVAKELLKGFSYSSKPYIIKAQTVSFHSFPVMHNLDDVIDNILIGIKHSLYPVPSLNCNVCDVRLKCPWYDNKN